MPKDVAYISSKSGVDTSRDGKLEQNHMISAIGLLVPVSLKKLFLKTKTCCISNPDHMTATDCSFNTSGWNVGEVFSKNRLHHGIQSAVYGEQQGFKPFKKKLCVLQ